MYYPDGFIPASAFYAHIFLVIVLPLIIVLALLGSYWYLAGRKSQRRSQIKKTLKTLAYCAAIASLGGLAWYFFVFIPSGNYVGLL